LSQLKPGTTLNSTYTETQTTVMDRTVETLEGRVWYVSPPTVILILSTGEAKKYSITKDWTGKLYDGNKKEITVFDLRKDMQISGTKITEAPRVEFSRDVVITGTAPKAEAAAAPAPRTEAAPAPAPTEEPKKLPKTGTPLPLAGLIGLLLTGASLGIRRFRR
jgi:LPXTG-motif cell wall-anchored protein